MTAQQNVIIFDGPDMCGKTEMAQHLSRMLNIPYFKNTCEKKFFEKDPGYFTKALKYGDSYFASYLKQTGASVILDRSFPSEFVYSQIMSRETNWDILRMIDTMFTDVCTKIIIPVRTTYLGIKDDIFDVLDESKLSMIDKKYREFAMWTSCDTLILNVDDEDLEREMRDIIPFIHETYKNKDDSCY